MVILFFEQVAWYHQYIPLLQPKLSLFFPTPSTIYIKYTLKLHVSLKKTPITPFQSRVTWRFCFYFLVISMDCTVFLRSLDF